MRYTNHSNLPLSVGVWLSHDSYQHDDRPNHISATALLKPLKQLIMQSRVLETENQPDIVGMIPSRMGTAIHDSIEQAWLHNYKSSLERLGYGKRLIDKIRVNPEKPEPNTIPIYLEQRAEREIDGFIISGQFDFIGDGRLEDFKSTSTYTYTHDTNADKYPLQGSIYRWLNPEKITRDQMAIQFIFTDWSGSRIREKGYPQSRTAERIYNLLSLQETETFIRQKLALIKKYWNAPEHEIPECSDKDLWRKETTFKVYKDSDARRAMSGGGSFGTDKVAAMAFAIEKGGEVRTLPGEVVACRFCEACLICKQKDRYLASGELKLGG